MKVSPQLFQVPKINSIQDMLIKSAKSYEDKLALEDLKETPVNKLTYSSLMKNILRFGKALDDIKLPKRSHIAIISENRVQWGITYLTAMCFNHVVVPIDAKLTTNEILNIIHESDTNVIVFSEQFESLLRHKQHTLKHLKYYIGMDLLSKKEGFFSMTELINNSKSYNIAELPKIDTEALAVIIFNSGTLGRAKGVMLSQKNLASNLMAMASMVKLLPEDRFLSILPIHHTYECTCGFLCPLYMGSSVHYAKSLKTVVDDLQESKATILLGVPLLYDKMFKRIYKGIKEKKIASLIIRPLIKITNIAERFGWKGAKKVVFSEIHKKFGGHIRLFIAGGAAPDPLVAKGLRALGFNFLQGYGLTETSPILTLNQLENFKDESAGIPLPDVDIKINQPDNEGIGEIYAKGSNVMIGFYKNEKATTGVFDNGWFKTGDLGYIDSDGFLHICGRKKKCNHFTKRQKCFSGRNRRHA